MAARSITIKGFLAEFKAAMLSRGIAFCFILGAGASAQIQDSYRRTAGPAEVLQLCRSALISWPIWSSHSQSPVFSNGANLNRRSSCLRSAGICVFTVVP